MDVAQRHSLLLRCVKKELDELGEPTRVETFPFWHAGLRAVESYGCSVAVSHLLRFYRQAACLLLVLLLASLFPMLENYSRNAVRNECRAALHGSFGELTGWPASTEQAARCGLAGVDVKQDIGPVPALLMTGLGTCQEYSNATGRELETVFGISTFEARVASFEPLSPNATACTSPLFDGARLVSYWADTLTVLLVLGFLIQLRRSIVRETRVSDERQLTTGDYAVMITGLKRHFNPDDERDGQLGLESLLRQDLAGLGFKAEDIDHVEVGRECADESACLRRLAGLHVQRQEAQAKRASSSVYHHCNGSSVHHSNVHHSSVRHSNVRHSLGLRSDTGLQGGGALLCDTPQGVLGGRASVGSVCMAAVLAKHRTLLRGSTTTLLRGADVGVAPVAAPKAWRPSLDATDAPSPEGHARATIAAPDATPSPDTSFRPIRPNGARRPRASRPLGAWRHVKSKLHLNMHVNSKVNLLVGSGGGGAAAEAGGPGACARVWRAFRARRQRRKETWLEESISEGERQIQRLLLAEHRTTGHAFVVFKEEERRAEFVALFFRPKDFEPYMARLLRRACSPRPVAHDPWPTIHGPRPIAHGPPPSPQARGTEARHRPPGGCGGQQREHRGAGGARAGGCLLGKPRGE